MPMTVPFEFRMDKRVTEGTAELYHWREEGRTVHVLFFHSIDEFNRWTEGSPFKLINHWTVPVKYPKGK